jgi:hypothetical protein
VSLAQVADGGVMADAVGLLEKSRFFVMRLPGGASPLQLLAFCMKPKLRLFP